MKHSSYDLANMSVPTRTDIPTMPTAAQRVETVTAKMRHNRPNRRRKERNVTDKSLAWLAAEARVDINVLAAQLPHRYDETGFRLVDQRVAATYLTEVREKDARAKELERVRAAAAAADDPAPARRRRIRALKAAQGVPADGSLSALAAMLANGPDDRLAQSGAHLDEMLSGAGGMVIHKIRKD
jgi:hypothetical protein